MARESELWSFIDVSAEMALDGTPDSDGGGSSSDSSGSGRQRPRRIHTFHGTTAAPSGGPGASPSASSSKESACLVLGLVGCYDESNLYLLFQSQRSGATRRSLG